MQAEVAKAKAAERAALEEQRVEREIERGFEIETLEEEKQALLGEKEEAEGDIDSIRQAIEFMEDAADREQALYEVTDLKLRSRELDQLIADKEAEGVALLAGHAEERAADKNFD
jgi:hypothetical protein